MKDVWKMTKPQLQNEAGQHFKVLNLYRALGGPVSKDEWEREVLELRDEVAAKKNRCECGHHTNYHSQQGCDFDGCTCAQHKPVGSEVPTVTLLFGMGLALDVPLRCASEQPRQGPAEDHVGYWVGRVDWTHASGDQIRTELREYGCWDDEELSDDEANRQRLLWIGCGEWQGTARPPIDRNKPVEKPDLLI